MFLEQLHTNDLSMNSGKKLREQLVENFTIIQKTFNEIDSRISKIETKLNKQDDIYNAGGGM